MRNKNDQKQTGKETTQRSGLKSSWKRVLKQILLSPFDSVSTVADVLELIEQDKKRDGANGRKLDKLHKELSAFKPDTELNTLVCSAAFSEIASGHFDVHLSEVDGLTKKEAEILSETLAREGQSAEISSITSDAPFEVTDVDVAFAIDLNDERHFNVTDVDLLQSYSSNSDWETFENKSSISDEEKQIRQRVASAFKQESALAGELTPVFSEPVGECFSKMRHIVPITENLASRTRPVSSLQTFHFETYRRFEFKQNWTVYSITDKLDYGMVEDFIYLALDYPEVRSEFIQYLKNPSIAISIVQSAVQSRLKEGRDSYREGNYKTTLSELYKKVSDRYSSLPVEAGRNVLVALIVQLIVHEIADSHLIKIDAPYKVPVSYKAQVRHIPSVEDMETVLLTQLITQTLKLGEKLAFASDKTGGGAFEKGKAIFLSDLDIEIRNRRRALVTIMTKLSVVHRRWQLVGAMALLKVYNLTLPQHDAIRSIIEDNQYLDELSRDLSFTWPFLSSYDVTETALGLSISSEEATVALATVYELWVSMRHWTRAPITGIRENIFSDTFKGVDGKRTGAVLTSFLWSKLGADQDALTVASRHFTQVQSRKFAIYEKHSYNRTESLMQELDDYVTGSNNDLSAYLYYASSSDVPIQGLVTNLSDFHLVLYYAATHNGLTHWDISEGQNSRGLLGKALGLPKTPRLVFKADVEYTDNIGWLPYRTGSKTYYFQNLYDWCIVYNHEKRDKITEGIYVLPVGIPRFGITDLLASTIELVNRGRASLKLSLNYNDGNDSYQVDVTTDFVGAEETARYASVYRDHVHYQVGSYNMALGASFAAIWNSAMADTLGLDDDDPRIQLEEAQALTERFVKTFRSSSLFQNILNKAVNGIILKISIEHGVNFAGVYGARSREIRNRLGLVIARVLSARLGLYSPEVLVKFEKSVEMVLNNGLYDLWQ